MLHRTVLLALTGLLALPVLIAAAAPDDSDATARAVAFIRSTQQPDGGFGGFGPGQSMDAVFALRAAGIDPSTVVAASGRTPVDYLETAAASAKDSATAAKFALGAVALGLNPTRVGSVDLLAVTRAGIDPATGRYAPGNDFAEAVTIIGLECTGNDADQRAVTALAKAQALNGGWGFGPDNAAIAIQALLVAGVPRDNVAIVKGVAYLRDAQLTDGGWGFDAGASDASTTAAVIQGLIAAGEDPASRVYRKNGRSPLDFLVTSQQPDGSFPGFDPAFATNLAVPALAGHTYCSAVTTPIKPAPPVAGPTGGNTPVPATPAPPGVGTGTAGKESGWPLLPVAVMVVALGAAAVAAARPR